MPSFRFCEASAALYNDAACSNNAILSTMTGIRVGSVSSGIAPSLGTGFLADALDGILARTAAMPRRAVNGGALASPKRVDEFDLCLRKNQVPPSIRIRLNVCEGAYPLFSLANNVQITDNCRTSSNMERA